MALTSIVLERREKENKKDTKQLFFTGLCIFHSVEFEILKLEEITFSNSVNQKFNEIV